jgi:hypothetical protein
MSTRLSENAHKVAFLIQQYPDKKLPDIIAMLVGWPEIDINAALWYAQDFGMIELDKDTGATKFLKEPELWSFGQRVQDIQDALLFCYHSNLVKRQYDLEEKDIADWLFGYPGCDIFVSLKDLIARKVLATYELTDPTDLKSTYTFYTLYENGEQMWGRVHFPHQQPTGAEKPESNEAPQEDATNE